MRFFTAFIIFVLSIAQSKAQDNQFSDNPNTFIDQLDDFMNASKRPDMAEAFSVFKKVHKSGLLPESDMKRIAALSNKMRSGLKFTAFPNFKNYINAISGAKMGRDSSVFGRWHAVAEKTVNSATGGKVKPVGQFLEFSADLLSSSALKTGEGGAITWYIRGGKWDFGFIDSSSQAVLLAQNVNLAGVRKSDSVAIFNTSGTFFPYTQRWKGQSGKVNWRDAGLDSTVFATLSRYEVDVNKPLFKCDTVRLSYPLYFPGRLIMGSMINNIEATAKDSSGSYPRFDSFEKTLSIPKLGEGIEYVGGFKLWGSSIYGQGAPGLPAQLTVYNKKREQVFAGKADLFLIRRETSIVGESVDARMKMNDGTEIMHPGAVMRLDIKKQFLSLDRGQKGSQRNPFYSTFYNMNLDAERVAYHFNADSLEIGAQVPGTKGGDRTVSFESSKLYEPATMIRMQNIAEKNPISSLYLVATRVGKDSNDVYVVSDNEFAAELNPKWNNANIQTLLAEMVVEGFINYYFEQHKIVCREKLLHYALAYAGKTDYDAIKIVSTTNQSSATLNLKTKETDIKAVKNLELSNRQHVAVIPSGNELTLLKNRDMRLSGRLFAGYALFEGRDMFFNYDKFDVAFDSVKNLDFYLPVGDKDPNTGLRKAGAMNSTIEYVSGVLLVDAPNNKSGKEDLSMFPSMQSKKNSYVYYQRKETQNNAYTRDSFFFKLDPFSFNALDDYDAEDLKFKGEMRPALIFPPFKETIVVRPEDKSFGFVHRTPQEGYPTYAEKGKYTGTVDLSNKGFLGKGVVEYLTADIESEDLIFRPKQMTGTAKKFFMEEDRQGAVKVPQASGQDVKVNWLPFRDSMYVESKAKDFSLFKAEGYAHKGTLILTPSGLKGKGVFEWGQGKLTSRLISYGPFQAAADTANLEIKSVDGAGALALDSKNVDGELDFDRKKGQFKANSAVANTKLPRAQYITSMNEFDWDMQEQVINFKADPNKPGVFISTDPNRDSLRFEGKTALYDIKNSQLKIGGVDVIKSADAFIYPDKGEITIKAGGAMEGLTNARIVADTSNKYHTINRAEVSISGKKDYKAKGYYQYNITGYDQEIFFDNIIGERVGGGKKNEKNVLTTAEGPIKPDANFRLGVKTLFKGKVELEAKKPNLHFEGFAKLDADKLPGSNWFFINSDVDKNDPLVRIKGSRNEAEAPTVTGIYLSKETGECYPRILAFPYARVDRPLMDAQGFFKYESANDRFIFGDSARIAGSALRGTKMIFDNRVGSLLSEGPIALGSGLNYMKIKAAGKLRTDFNVTDSTTYKITGEVMSGAEFFLPPKVLGAFLDGIRAATYDAPNAIYTAQNAFYQQAVPEFIPNEKLDATITADLKNNLILLPKDDNKFTLLLGKHNVIWNPEYQSFLSTDDKLPIITIGGEQINKVLTTYVEYKMPNTVVEDEPEEEEEPLPDEEMTGEEEEEEEDGEYDVDPDETPEEKAQREEEQKKRAEEKAKKAEELEKKRAEAKAERERIKKEKADKRRTKGDDRFYVYISATPELWYFFGYQKGTMSVTSSDTKFNDLLAGMKPKDLQVKMPDGETYEVIPVNPSGATAFVTRVKEGRKVD
jgi:hypothetical protein